MFLLRAFAAAFAAVRVGGAYQSGPGSPWHGRASARTVWPPVVAGSSDPYSESPATSPPASATALPALSLAALLGCGVGCCCWGGCCSCCCPLQRLLGLLLLARACSRWRARALTSAAVVVKKCLCFWVTTRDHSSLSGHPQRRLVDSHCASAANVFGFALYKHRTSAAGVQLRRRTDPQAQNKAQEKTQGKKGVGKRQNPIFRENKKNEKPCPGTNGKTQTSSYIQTQFHAS